MHYFPLTTLWFIAIYAVCLMPVPDTPLNSVVGIDKVVHLGLWFVASLLIWWEYYRVHKKGRQLRRPWLLTVVLPILCSGSIELIQPYVGRSGEWWDFAFNSAGVLLAGGLVAIGIKCRDKD